REYAAAEGFSNVELRQRDLFACGMPDNGFQFVHARFVLAPIGRDAEVLEQLVRLARPGGVVAIQEPDPETWRCDPPSTAWDRLKDAVVNAFSRGGGDLGAGLRIASLLHGWRIRSIRVRHTVFRMP